MAQDFSVQHAGLTFKCRIDGAVEAPWLVFVNSLATDLRIWDAQVARFGGAYRILRYDQRGHGGTSVPAAPPTMLELGDDLIALLDHFGIADCAVVGLSMGCPTALHLVDRQPHRARLLVLTDGQAATAPNGASNWEARIESARAKGMAATAQETLARWFSPGFSQTPRGREMLGILADMTLDGFIAGARALQGYDYDHVLERITVPTLLLAGSNDGQMPVSMRNMAARIPGARFFEVADAGHIPNVEQPGTYNGLLADFLLTADRPKAR